MDFYGFSYFFLDFFQLLGLVVHYANLVLLNKYTFLTEVGTRVPGTGGAHVLLQERIAKWLRYCRNYVHESSRRR